ncbi:MAG TPA: helix-turn-helix domain-containing protein [Desulfosporosinus sp.]|nr:helix-turn-helix domain-containing protein [Desulfosporosinus sp.]
MKTAKNRLSINELPDVFGPRDLARFLGVQQETGYNLVKRLDFPSIRLGNRFLINKQSFLRWFSDQETQKAASV